MQRTIIAVALVAATASMAPPPSRASTGTTELPGLRLLSKAPAWTSWTTGGCDDDTTWVGYPFFSAGGQPQLQRVYLNTTGIPAGLKIEKVERALGDAVATWNDARNPCGFPDTSTFKFTYAGRISGTPLPADDKIQTVAFTTGVCAVGQVACTRLHYDPANDWPPLGWDVMLVPGYDWGFDGGLQLDIHNALTHEFGHVVGLADVDATVGGTCANHHAFLTMYACTWPGDRYKRDLGRGDHTGVTMMSEWWDPEEEGE